MTKSRFETGDSDGSRGSKSSSPSLGGGEGSEDDWSDADTLEAWVRQAFEFAGAVGQVFDWGADTGEHGSVEVAERGFLRIDQVPSRGEGSPALPGQDDGQVVRIVRVAIAHARAQQDHRIIEQRPVPFLDRTHSLEHVGILGHVPGVDEFILLELLILVLVMGYFMVAAPDPFQKRKIMAAHGIAEHEGANPRRV